MAKAKKFSGKILARIGPKLHARITAAVTNTEAESVNELIIYALRRFLDGPNAPSMAECAREAKR